MFLEFFFKLVTNNRFRISLIFDKVFCLIKTKQKAEKRREREIQRYQQMKTNVNGQQISSEFVLFLS